MIEATSLTKILAYETGLAGGEATGSAPSARPASF